MHYYKRNIGDYAKKAGRLSMAEHGAYTLLIDACYDRERFPTLEDAIEWTWARTAEEIHAVEFVLSRFFTLTDGLYVQNRIQEEINAYHANAQINKRIATEREEKRRERTRTVHEASTTVNEAPPNQEPRTINQEPVNNKTQDIQAPEGVSTQVWQDFKKSRKTLRAAITQSAIDGIKREADKAGWPMEDALVECCTRGWRSFKADWVTEAKQPLKSNGLIAGAI